MDRYYHGSYAVDNSHVVARTAGGQPEGAAGELHPVEQGVMAHDRSVVVDSRDSPAMPARDTLVDQAFSGHMALLALDNLEDPDPDTYVPLDPADPDSFAWDAPETLARKQQRPFLPGWAHRW